MTRLADIPEVLFLIKNSQNSGEIYGLPFSLTDPSLHDFQGCPWGEGGGGGWIFYRVAHNHSSFEGKLMNFIPNPKYYKYDNCWKSKILRGPKFVSPKFVPLNYPPPH